VIEKTIAHIESQRERFLGRLMDLLRIPSISTDPDRRADMRRGVEWVHQHFMECGINSEIVETRGHPAVIADSGPVNGAPTLLVYGHYDVQPAGDESLWSSPPFEPAVRDGTIFARGAADDKGQILAHLFAAQSWLETAGGLPVRCKFLIEGEEEIGSPNIESVVRDCAERLACDYVVLSDTPKFDAETPAITYGTKGLVYKEIIVYGPKQDLHSGQYGGTVTNPGNALAVIIASLRDAERRVTIPGFYDAVREPTAEERSRMSQLPFDEADFRAVVGVDILDGETGFNVTERRWCRPTLDVNGLLSGFTGEGASTIIPAKAMAKVSMRLVPDQDFRRISAAFDDAVQNAAPPGVKIEIKNHASCAAYLCPLDSPGIKAASMAIEAGFGNAPVFTREGGTLPILPLFKEVLGADSILIGLCHPNCNAHGPDEFFEIANFVAGMKTSAHFMHNIAVDLQ